MVCFIYVYTRGVPIYKTNLSLLICWWYVIKWMKVLQAPVRMKMGTHTLIQTYIYVCVCVCTNAGKYNNGSKWHILYSIHKCNLREWKQMKMVPEFLPNFSSTNGLISTIYVYTYVQYTRYVFKNTHILQALYLHFLMHAFIFSSTHIFIYSCFNIDSFVDLFICIHLLIYSYLFIGSSMFKIYYLLSLQYLHMCKSWQADTPRSPGNSGHDCSAARWPSAFRSKVTGTGNHGFPHQTKGGFPA
jgi:hypothetical protein